MCICMYICIIYRILNVNIRMPHASISVVRLIMTTSKVKRKYENERERSVTQRKIPKQHSYTVYYSEKLFTFFRVLV